MRNKTMLSTVFLLMQVFYAIGQEPIIEWQKSYGGFFGELAYYIQQTTDGGYFVSGLASSRNGDVSGNHGSSDYWLIKITANGDIEWDKSYGGSSNDSSFSAQQTADGGYILAGKSSSQNGDVTVYHGGRDCWVVKTSASGTIEWQKSYGGSGSDELNSIQQTTDGGYILFGRSDSNDGDVTDPDGNSDCWVVKITSTGVIEWEKSYGGTSGELAADIRQTVDGGYIFASYTESSDGDVSNNQGFRDIWIVKVDSFGNIVWEKSLGGTDGDHAKSVRQTTDGGYIVLGYIFSDDGDINKNNGKADYWVVKLTSTGSIEWEKSYGGSENDLPECIQQTSDNGYIIAGNTKSIDGDVTSNHGQVDCWILKLDSNGLMEWQKTFGGDKDDYATYIQETDDGNYIFTGYSSSINGDLTENKGFQDFWIVKLSSTLDVNSSAYSFFSLYPNPATNILNVESRSEITNIEIYNNLGQTVFFKFNANNIDISKLKTGIYFVKIEDVHGNLEIKKIIKK